MKLNPDAQCVFQSTQQVRIECHFEHIPGPWSKPQGTADEKVEDEEVDEFLTDYDFRHRHRLIPPLATLPHGSYCFVSIRLILQRAEAAVVTGATVGFGFLWIPWFPSAPTGLASSERSTGPGHGAIAANCSVEALTKRTYTSRTLHCHYTCRFLHAYTPACMFHFVSSRLASELWQTACLMSAWYTGTPRKLTIIAPCARCSLCLLSLPLSYLKLSTRDRLPRAGVRPKARRCVMDLCYCHGSRAICDSLIPARYGRGSGRGAEGHSE